MTSRSSSTRPWRSGSRESRCRRATAIITRRARMCSSVAAPASGCSARSSSAAAHGAGRGGSRRAGPSTTRACSWISWPATRPTSARPGAHPTYNLFGWQRPCYLLTDEGYAPTFKSLMEDTDVGQVRRRPQSRLRQLHGALRLRGHGGERCVQLTRSRHSRRPCRVRAHGPDGGGSAHPLQRRRSRPAHRRHDRGGRREIEPTLEPADPQAPGADEMCATRWKAGREQRCGGATEPHEISRHSATPSRAQLEIVAGAHGRGAGRAASRADVVPTRLHEAMRYSVLGGGKRIRPALVFATARAVGSNRGGSRRRRPAPSS